MVAPDHFTTSRSFNDNGRINQRLEGIISGCFNRGFLLEGEIRGLYQCIRVESGEIGQISVDIHKIQRSAKSLSSNAQPSGIKLTFKNGGQSQQESFRFG